MACLTVLFATIVVYFTTTFVFSLPVRPPRSMSGPGVTFIQKPKFDYAGAGHEVRQLPVGQCQEIDDVKQPTTIEAQEEGYKLVTFSTSCDEPEQKEIGSESASKSITVNDRVALCSFKTDAPYPLEATFFRGDSPVEGTHTLEINDTMCINICANDIMAPYFQSVEISANGKSVADALQIFSDNDCRNLVKSVGSGDLVEITRRDNANVVKSFTFIQD